MRCSNLELRWLPTLDLAPPQFPVDVTCYFTAAVFTTVELFKGNWSRDRPTSAAADEGTRRYVPYLPRLAFPAAPTSLTDPREPGILGEESCVKPASDLGCAFPLKIIIGACKKCRGPDPAGFSLSHPSVLPGVPALFFISEKPWTRSKVHVAMSKTRGGGEQRADSGAKRGRVTLLGQSVAFYLFLLAWAAGRCLQLRI